MTDSPFRQSSPQGGQGASWLFDLDPSLAARYIRLGLAALFAILILYGLRWFLSFYADWLWFGQLGYEEVLFTVVTSQIWLFLFGLVMFLAIAGSNVYLVFRLNRNVGVLVGGRLPEHWVQSFRRALRWISVAVVLVLGMFVAAQAASAWEMILRYLSAVPFDRLDPIFQKDLSFYVFSLPVIRFVRSWFLTGLILTLLVVVALYYVLAQLRETPLLFVNPFRAHLLGLGAVFFLLIAVGHWLARYELLYSTSGAVVGVGWTEAHIGLPAATFMALVSLLAAGVLVYIASRGSDRLILWTAGGWFVLNIVATGVLPAAVQRLYVEPSELALEEPYLAHHIEMTRRAYGLDRIQSLTHPARGAVDSQIISENPGTVQNVRLWDEGPLLESYNQIQFFRLYYDFLSVTTDRYQIDGDLRQVMLSTRELSAEKLPSEAQRWVNRRLQFTHGYGVAMSPVTEVDAGGRPTFFIKNVPPEGKLALQRPDVYYGLKSLEYLIVNTRMQEFNYPGPEGPVYTHYQGKGGVQLSSLFRKILYAWQFWDLNILISAEISRDSRVQYHRTVTERFSKLAPFLIPDRNPYVVVADGRIFWIQDAYTITDRYPYSATWEGQFNYIRNSVKTVVDAYDGSIQFYIADDTDPLLQTYQRIFPSMFLPMEEMPEYLKSHVRYPSDFFTAQVHMLLQYQMKNPTVFYNKEDQWDLPVETSFGRSSTLLPYYIVARLPQEEKEEFLLIQPFTPVNRHNLVAWIAARSDPPNYGDLILFRFPSGRHVDGPNQVEARIDNDAVISEQFTLWGQVGSEVSRGILLVIPIGDAILYAEPVFLRPEALEFPELRRIILADDDQVVMQPSLQRSIRALVGELPAVAPIAEPGGVESPPSEESERRPQPTFRSEQIETIRSGLREISETIERLLQTLENQQ